jgi:hypothetical protein
MPLQTNLEEGGIYRPRPFLNYSSWENKPMDIREQLKNPVATGVAGLIVGALIGLIVLGWWLFPVQYTGAGPKDLRPEAKADYMRMAIESYGLTRDANQAKARYDALGADANQVLQEVANQPGAPNVQLVQAFATAVTASAPAPAVGTVAPGETPAVTQTAAPSTGGGGLGSLLPILCLVVLLVVAAVIVYFIMRNRGMTLGAGTVPPAQAPPTTEWTDYQAGGTSEPPMAQFMAAYKLGDDLFDDSFSIDSPAGEFLGECGVGISETIGVGDPKKVTAFEVWLFDKNDIQTVTKVLMSAHAFNDEATRQRLAAKGEPILIEPGTESVLETQTLQLVARVVDLGYGDGALPEESFFDRFTLELAVWPKA